MRVMQRPIVLTLSGLALGVSLGLLVSFVFFSPTGSKTVTKPNTDITLPSPKNDADQEDLASAPTSLDAILKLETASARRLALYELIQHQGEEQIADLLRLSFSISSDKHLSSVQDLLFAALARLNPELSLELVWQSERSSWDTFFNTVFKEWGNSDPQLALQTGSELGEPWQSKAFRTVFQTRQDFSDSERTELASSFGATRVLNELTFDIQIDKVMDEPRTAFELILQADVPDFRKSETAAWITERWLETDDINNIGSMLSLVYEVFSEDQYQWRIVVSTIAETNPKLVWKQLSTLTLDAQKMLNDEVFKVWVKQDPTEAVTALNDYESMSSELWELPALYAAWVRVDWEQLPEKIDLVPVDHQPRMLTIAVRDLAPRIEPRELLEQLRKLQDVGVNTKSTLESYFTNLSDWDPVAALQLASEYLDEGSYVFSLILRELAVGDVNKAMEFALQQPESTGLEQSVVRTMFGQGWLEKGLELLPKVRNGTSTTNLYVSAGSLLIENGRISEAIELAKKLPEGDQTEYFVNLSGFSSYSNSFLFVEILPQLPSEEIRAQVAEHMLRIDSFLGALTDDEIEVVSSFLRETTE
ncbi:MAG: hypothetical protein F4X56_08325 [Gammaproteobacteria bacterium]|nr:hypothetical protein [Gammaproteobacteria bacterium]